jgi:endoglucanase
MKYIVPAFVVITTLATCGTVDTPQQEYQIRNNIEPVVSGTTAPFSKGVNLTSWFQASSPHEIPFTKFGEADFANIKSLGADVIRLPLNLHNMTSGAPDYTLDSLFLKFLDEAVDFAEKHEIYIILDNHSSDGSNGSTPSDIDTILVPVWTQMADHFKDRGKYVLYEILNEPYGDDLKAERWGEIQQDVIDAIRSKDKTHTIVVGGNSWNSIDALASLPRYADTNLLYTFHFYDPHIFTHQGASWNTPSMINLKGVPFPADAHAMPQIPADLKGSWVESSLKDYAVNGNAETLAKTLNKAAKFSNERGVPVFCGEFGVYMINADAADRTRWYQFVAPLLDERHISRTNWDYFGGFGLFNKEAGGDFRSDLNLDVVRALGFTPPTQQLPEKIKDSFVIYGDYPGTGIASTHWGQSQFDLYAEPPASGDFAIAWRDIPLYEAFYFEFNKVVDWQYLRDNGYSLQFKAKAALNEGDFQFDVRFMNTESASSIPWRMRLVVDGSLLPADGKWHDISVKLSDMKEHGAWVNATKEWHEPTGKFSWNDIASLQFAAEKIAINGTIWFDDIQVVK